MNKPYIIAEIGVNYYDIAIKKGLNNFSAAKLMIKKAKESGADAVKFQTYKADKLASKKSPAYWDLNKESTKTQYELFKKFDKFEKEDYAKLARYSEDIGIDFLSTPFDLDSVDFLNKIVPFFKIASADITNKPLLEKVAEKNKKIFLSTGASKIEEIKNAIKIIKNKQKNAKIVLMHCVLSYPTKYSDANLNRIKILKKEFPNLEIGYSDHTMPDESMLTPTTAYLFGANIIEKHFTLDKNIKGNDHYHSMDPADLRKFNKNIKLLRELLSKKNKNYLVCEKDSRLHARRSIFLKKDMRKGEVITEKDLIMKRPGTGISPSKLNEVIGKSLKKNVKEDDLLKKEDLKN